MESLCKIMKFDIDAVCSIIRSNEFKIVTLQFPDEFLPISVEIYDQLSSQLSDDVSLFIAADSTYGSSLDDVSALHVESDVLVYFGSDLSSSGSVPVIVAPEIKEININECMEQVCNSIISILNTKSKETASSSSAGCIQILLCYEASYQYSVAALGSTLETKLHNQSIDANIHVAKLPPHLDLHNRKCKSVVGAGDKNSDTESSNDSTSITVVGGLLVDAIVTTNTSTIVIYIGDKSEQLTAILLHLSQNQVIAYSPTQSTLRVLQGSSSREFQQRSGGMLKVKDALTIGIIVGSMGLTADLTQATLHRLQLLIQESGRRHYTFAMGRLNEAKLSNFPEIDLFCLISNDDSSLIPAKTFHAPVITPWELELGLGARNWQSVFKTNSASVLESGGLLTDEVSLEVAVERVRKLRLENKREDSDDEVSVDHNGESSADVTNCSSVSNGVMVSTQGSRQLMKVSEVGTDYYRDREYKGLDPSISTDKLPDTNVVQGQSGLPVSYKYS